MEKIIEILPLLIPLIIIQLGVQIYCLVNLSRINKVNIRFNNKIIWVIIIMVNLLGAVIYLAAGRINSIEDSSRD